MSCNFTSIRLEIRKVTTPSQNQDTKKRFLIP